MASLEEFLKKSKASTTFLARKVVLAKAIRGKADNLISDKVYTVIIIVLVALASFGLGKLSKIEENKPLIKLIDNSAAPAAAGAAVSSFQSPVSSFQSGNYVASKSGTKYHFPWCSGAQRIKEKNKIWFDTKEEAEKAGYGPAANCKGI